jgi:hypothetical protein
MPGKHYGGIYNSFIAFSPDPPPPRPPLFFVRSAIVGIYRANLADFLLDLRNCHIHSRIFMYWIYPQTERDLIFEPNLFQS